MKTNPSFGKSGTAVTGNGRTIAAAARPFLLFAGALVAAPLVTAGCVDSVKTTGQACPCAGGNVCCPSGMCAPNAASCDSGNGALAVAPAALTFTRKSDTVGSFSWSAVPGATSYALYKDGVEAATTAETSADLVIGPGAVDVTVAGKNDEGASPKSTPFPVLFNVSVRACGSDNAEVRWETKDATDTALSIERPSKNTISCSEPTPRSQHLWGDMASCTQTRLPTGTGGRLDSGSTMTLNLLSRDQLGYLGTVRRTFTLPPRVCLCASSSKAAPNDGCNFHPTGVHPMTGLPIEDYLAGCGLGFDFETGTVVSDASQADVFVEVSEDANGTIVEARLVAPRGVATLKGKAMCDVVEAPASGYAQKVVIGSGDASRFGGTLTERQDSLVVKTRSGRYAKLSIDFNGPAVGAAGIPLVGGAGLSFGWSLAPVGSTTFPD